MEEDTRALIIVDVQPTFCEGGALGVEGGNAVAERIADFVTENADEYELLVTTQDWHVNPGSHFSDTPDFVDTWPEHGVAGTAEAELHEAIASLPLDASVKKGEYSAAYSGFEGKDAEGRTLEEILRAAGIQAIDVVGLAESHCVKETALDALRLGWRTRVLSDLTVPVSPETGEDARREMDEAGVEQIPTASAFGFYEEGEDAPIPGDFADEPQGDGSGFAGGELDDLGDLDDYDNLDDFDGLDDNLDVPSGGEAGAPASSRMSTVWPTWTPTTCSRSSTSWRSSTIWRRTSTSPTRSTRRTSTSPTSTSTLGLRAASGLTGLGSLRDSPPE